MRITVDIPKVLYRKLKSRAAREGTSVTKLVLRGIHAEMERCGNASKPDRIKLPIIRSKKAGRLKLTSAAIDEILFS